MTTPRPRTAPSRGATLHESKLEREAKALAVARAQLRAERKSLAARSYEPSLGGRVEGHSTERSDRVLASRATMPASLRAGSLAPASAHCEGLGGPPPPYATVGKKAWAAALEDEAARKELRTKASSVRALLVRCCDR